MIFDQDEPKTVDFNPEAVKEYLDTAIRYWRLKVGQLDRANYYVDAYQSVRASLFGETLSNE